MREHLFASKVEVWQSSEWVFLQQSILKRHPTFLRLWRNMPRHALDLHMPIKHRQRRLCKQLLAIRQQLGSETADGRMNGAGFGELGADYQTINATETAIALLRLCYLEGHNAAS